MTSTYAFRPAAGADYGKVIDLWMRGVSSDRVAIDQIANTWWKRLLFRYVAGRKIFQQDMETAVVLKDGNLCGYYGLQAAADTMSVFDWGLNLDWSTEGLNVFGLMVEHILDDVYERDDDTESLVIGTERHEHDVRTALEQNDFEPLDYQIAQMVTDLPLAHNEPRGEMDLHLALRNAHSFGDAIEDWIRVDYQGDKRKAAIVLPIHNALPLRTVTYEILDGEDSKGFVQFSSHNDEARFLYALDPDLWGSPLERLAVTAFCTQLARKQQRVRLRTFSLAHLHASRESLASLGLKFELAPWERWVHLLFEEGEEDDDAIGDNES